MATRVIFLFYLLSLLWGIWVYGAVETQNSYRLFLLCLISVLVAAWRRPLTSSPILLTAVGLVLVLNVALRSTLEAQGYLVAALGWMALFVVVRLSTDSRANARRVMLFIVAIGVAEAGYGFLQLLNSSRDSVTGTLVNRNHFAGLLNMTIALAVGATYAAFHQRMRAGHRSSEVHAWSWLVGLTCLLTGLAVLLSRSRGGIVSLTATLVFLGLLLALKRRSRTRARRGLSPGYAWVLLLAIFSTTAWIGADALVGRFAETQKGLADRAVIAKASIQLIAERPWSGVGPGMYKWRFRPYQPAPITSWYDHAHNDYIESAAEWGVPVALVFWSFVVWRFLAATRVFLASRRDPWLQGAALGCAGALFSILLHSLVDFNLQIPTTLMVFCTVLGLSLSLKKVADAPDGTGSSHPLRRIPLYVRVAVPTLLTVVLVFAGITVSYRLVAWQLFLSDPTVEGTKEALRWDPNVPDFYFHIGLIKRDVPDHLDLDGSISSLERAVALNPYRWDYLNELGRSYELRGREIDALRLYEQSVEVNPRSGLYHWRLGNYYLRTKGLAAATPLFQKAVALDPSYMTAAAQLLWHVGAVADELLVMCPPDTQSRLALLKVLEADRAAPSEAIDALWSQILASTPPPTLAEGLFHLDYLHRTGRFGEMREVWINLCHNNHLSDNAFQAGDNELWNGRFELPIYNQGPDWRVNQGAGYSVRLAAGEGVSGSTAFRIDFSGQENPEVEFLRQAVYLEAGQDYEVGCRMRSQALTSDQGVYLQVNDPRGNRQIWDSDRILGSNDWRKLVFRIPSSSNISDTPRILSVTLRRDKSGKIDNKLSGTLWVDDIFVRKTRRK